MGSDPARNGFSLPWSRRPDAKANFQRALLELLPGAVALCRLDGRLSWTSTLWRHTCGASSRLSGNPGVFVGLRSARDTGHATAVVVIGGGARCVRIDRISPDVFLLRCDDPGPGPLEVGAPPGPRSLDKFAAKAPIGAALISGSEPFTGQIEEVNSALAEIVDVAEPVGTVFGQIFEPESLAISIAAWAGGDVGPYEIELLGPSLRTVHLYLTPAAGGWQASLLDVTAQKQLQTQLAQRNKMEAIGQLAGGVAHDFNNLLTAIRLRADDLILRHPLGDPAYENLSEIRQTVERAADVVRQLLSFSRMATVRRERLDLGEVLSSFQVLLRRLLREDVQLITEYGRDLPQVRADRAMLENAVMNLVVNARDAIARQGGGLITMRTMRLNAPGAAALGYDGPPGGDLALIEISDDGPGMDAETQAKIFDPFFTTKAVGEGTGLGLATVWGIVKQLDGVIVVKSAPGQGASFRIFLPEHAPVLITPVVAIHPPQTVRDLSGVGRILFVEDELAVRGIAARVLRGRGYEVIEACDGEEALALAAENAGKIDLLITDVVMPGMDGPTLLKLARTHLGPIPVLFISGYAEADFSNLLEDDVNVKFLAKPLDINSLCEQVKSAIQSALPSI